MAEAATAAPKMPNRCERLAAFLLRMMARGNMAQLMAQDGGQLRLVVPERQQPACDIDVAPGSRERVDDR